MEKKKKVGKYEFFQRIGWDAQGQWEEILIQLVKKLEPEEIAFKLQQFDSEMCTQAFLSELKRVLPSPEEVSNFSLV